MVVLYGIVAGVAVHELDVAGTDRSHNPHAPMHHSSITVRRQQHDEAPVEMICTCSSVSFTKMSELLPKD